MFILECINSKKTKHTSCKTNVDMNVIFIIHILLLYQKKKLNVFLQNIIPKIQSRKPCPRARTEGGGVTSCDVFECI